MVVVVFFAIHLPQNTSMGTVSNETRVDLRVHNNHNQNIENDRSNLVQITHNRHYKITIILPYIFYIHIDSACHHVECHANSRYKHATR